MKSICIKTNNDTLLAYLLNELHLCDLQDVCFSQNQFKHYNNIIIHYTGNNSDTFIHRIADILSYMVIDELEEFFLKDSISQNYFYFDSIERKKILQVCFDICSDDFTHYFDKKFSYLTEQFYLYLKEHNSIILTGFIYFRLKSYFSILDEIVDNAVNQFMIEKEYLEFVSLLKLYINSQPSNTDILHLIYLKNNYILLDNNMNQIDIQEYFFDAKYLSDITFSNNDYLLNALLNLLPKKLYIHLIENSIDEFLNTLILIFENHIDLCTDCTICQLYRHTSNKSELKS